MFRIPTNLLLISTLLLTPAFSQVAKPELVPYSKMRKRILTKDRFANVPERVRNFHAKGSINVLVQIDRAGNVEKLSILSGFNHIDFFRPYIEKEVRDWKFKPLKRNGRVVPYRGLILIPFCYGGFPGKRSC